jgi:hypothetical protein
MKYGRPANAAEARTAHPDAIVRMYVGTPLGATTRMGVFNNFRRAAYCNRLMLDEGYAAIAPHLIMCMLLDEHDPLHRQLGINYDMALMAGMQEVVLFTPDGTPGSFTAGLKLDAARQSDLDARWANLAAEIDERTLEAAHGLIQRGLPVQYRVFPEVPEDWSPSFLTPGGYWMKPVESLAGTTS